MRTVVKRALSGVAALALTVGLAGAGTVSAAVVATNDEGTTTAHHWCWYQGWRPCPWH